MYPLIKELSYLLYFQCFFSKQAVYLCTCWCKYAIVNGHLNIHLFVFLSISLSPYPPLLSLPPSLCIPPSLSPALSFFSLSFFLLFFLCLILPQRWALPEVEGGDSPRCKNLHFGGEKKQDGHKRWAPVCEQDWRCRRLMETFSHGERGGGECVCV